MNSFQMKNKLSPVLGDQPAEERASISSMLQDVIRRLDRMQTQIDDLQKGHIDLLKSHTNLVNGHVDIMKGQVNLIKWVVGVGVTAVSLTVGIIKFL